MMAYSSGARHRKLAEAGRLVCTLAVAALLGALCWALVTCHSSLLFAAPPKVVVGSKAFTEGVILGDMVTALARSSGVAVEHRRSLGGTRVLWDALLRGEIEIYPDRKSVV